jgi:tetratricopeptide (TPR) repeat protein
MGYDAQREDFTRLAIAYARAHGAANPLASLHPTSAFAAAFREDASVLPITDASRAFHLMAQAVQLIDLQIPFEAAGAQEQLAQRATILLHEAVHIDPLCFDAQRLLAAHTCPTLDDFYRVLLDGRATVLEVTRARVTAEKNQWDDAASSTMEELLWRPYLRWQLDLAREALACGRYRSAIAVAKETLELDPHDGANIASVAYLAFAKLEDELGLHDFLQTLPPTARAKQGTCPWYTLARCALAYKRCDVPAALRHLSTLCKLAPHARELLCEGGEHPESCFSRFPAEAASDDEFQLCLAEGALLLEEGANTGPHGALGQFMLNVFENERALVGVEAPVRTGGATREGRDERSERDGYAGRDGRNDHGHRDSRSDEEAR